MTHRVFQQVAEYLVDLVRVGPQRGQRLGDPDPEEVGALPGIQAVAATGIAAFIAAHGAAAGRVFATAGLAPDTFAHPRHRLPLVAYCDLFEQAARQTGIDTFGLRFGLARATDALGDVEESHVVEHVRLVTAPFQEFGHGILDHGAADVVLGIGFLGLLLCVVYAVADCVAMAGSGTIGRGRLRWSQVVCVLMGIGAVVPVIMGVIAHNSDNAGDAGGPAMFVFVPGVVLYGVLLMNGAIGRLLTRSH